MAVRHYVLCALTLLIGVFVGSKLDRRQSIQIPSTKAYLKVPLGCRTRLWMNGVETDCPNGATIYYMEKLKQASPQ